MYALGCTLYEAATGIKPFGGMSDQEIIFKQANVKLAAQPIQPMNATINPQTENTILKAIEKDPANRFSSMEEVLLDPQRNPDWQDAQDTKIL